MNLCTTDEFNAVINGLLKPYRDAPRRFIYNKRLRRICRRRSIQLAQKYKSKNIFRRIKKINHL